MFPLYLPSTCTPKICIDQFDDKWCILYIICPIPDKKSNHGAIFLVYLAPKPGFESQIFMPPIFENVGAYWFRDMRPSVQKKFKARVLKFHLNGFLIKK